MPLNENIITHYARRIATDCLTAIDPLFRSRPVYIIAKSPCNAMHLPQDFPTAHGWTGTRLAEQCKSYLQSCGEWRGPGFATIVHRVPRSAEDTAFMGTCLHEACHWSEWQVTTAENHGATFHRAATHIHRRGSRWLQAHGIHLSLCDMIGGRHCPADPYAVAESLAGELRQSTTPIVDHLRAPMPAAFAELFGVAKPTAPARRIAPPAKRQKAVRSFRPGLTPIMRGGRLSFE